MSSRDFSDTPHLTPEARQKVVLVLCLTIFCSVLNGTMFNIAVPDIAREFGLSTVEVSWVITGYVTLFALGALAFGKLADRYPVRRLILIGLLLFNAGALLGLTAGSYPQLVLGRLIQACGGSSIPALGMLTATRFVPPDRRGRVLGLIAATVAFAAGVGPMLGGILAGVWHWRWLFLISLPTLVTLPAYMVLLPQERTAHRRFDPLGAIFTGVLVCSLLLFVVYTWWPGPILGLGTAILLNRHLRRTAEPFLPLSLFDNRAYLLALGTAFLAVGTVFGMMFLVPILLRDLYGLPTLLIGLVIFPGAMCAALVGIRAGRLADRIGALRVVHRGLPLLAGGFGLLALWTDAPFLLLIPILMVCYSGFACIHASLAKSVSLVLAPHETGIGMGLYNLVFFLSGAFGTALAGRLRVLFAPLTDFPPWVSAGARPFSAIFCCMLGTVLAAFVLARSLPAEQPAESPLD